MSDKTQSDESSEWPYPDHYVTLDCPNCEDFSLATAKRCLDNGKAFCYECGRDFQDSDVMEIGPHWE